MEKPRQQFDAGRRAFLAALAANDRLTSIVSKLEQRIEDREDSEDLQDLEQAIAENGDKPLVPWEQVKSELNID